MSIVNGPNVYADDDGIKHLGISRHEERGPAINAIYKSPWIWRFFYWLEEWRGAPPITQHTLSLLGSMGVSVAKLIWVSQPLSLLHPLGYSLFPGLPFHGSVVYVDGSVWFMRKSRF